MTQPPNLKPAARPVSLAGDQPTAQRKFALTASEYRRLPVGEKRELARDRQREPALTCPTCATQVMPAELAAHQVERCTLDMPPPHPASKWLIRVYALRYAPSSRLDAWVARGLVRQREDGAYLERDLAIVTAWARALEAL